MFFLVILLISLFVVGKCSVAILLLLYGLLGVSEASCIGWCV